MMGRAPTLAQWQSVGVEEKQRSLPHAGHFLRSWGRGPVRFEGLNYQGHLGLDLWLPPRLLSYVLDLLVVSRVLRWTVCVCACVHARVVCVCMYMLCEETENLTGILISL